MNTDFFPLIDVEATGKNIERLRKLRNLSVKDIQNYFGFEEPQAIYKWQWGKTLPSVDNLFALSYLLDVPLGDILVAKERVAEICGSHHFQDLINTGKFFSRLQTFIIKRKNLFIKYKMYSTMTLAKRRCI